MRMTITLKNNILEKAQKQAAAAGYADDVEAYLDSLIEEADEQADILAQIQEGIADGEAGRTQPVREAFEELAKKYNITLQSP